MGDPSGNVKHWLLNKCKDASSLLHGDQRQVTRGRYGSVVLTPSNIPEFHIPGSLDVRCREDSDTHSLSSDSSLPCSGHTSPRLSPATREPTPNLLTKPPSPHSSRSAPVSPVRANASSCGRLERYNTLAGDKVDIATNADPFSIAAMSLPHLKTMTNFGFETLRESPNTRRKESLFHDSPSFTQRSNYARKCRSCDCSPAPNTDDVRIERRLSYKRRNVPSVVAPLGVLLPLSNENKPSSVSPFCKSPSPRESTSPRGGERSRFQFSPKKERMMRTPSPVSFRDCEKVNMWLNSGRRQSCGPRLLIEDADFEPRRGTNHHKHNVLSKSLSMNSDLINQYTEDCENGVNDVEYGSIELLVEHSPITKVLKVTLVQCLSLHKKKPDIQLNPFATLCLMPGKLQRHTSTVVRGCNDPLFRETFLFRDLTSEQLQEMKVRVRIYHKAQSLRRKDFLGEAMLYLQDFDLSEQVRIQRQLQQRERDNKLGLLQVSLCFQPSLEKLTVIIMQAKDLARNPLTGPPDAYVRMDLQQPGRQESRIQTKIRKKSQNPVYNEEHLVTISPRIEDLNYARLTFTVYKHETIRSDEALGQVRLGFGATEESEFSHWNNVLQNPGRDYTFWHTLMEPDDTS